MFGNSSKARLVRNPSKAWIKYDTGDEVYDAFSKFVTSF